MLNVIRRGKCVSFPVVPNPWITTTGKKTLGEALNVRASEKRLGEA